MNKDIIAINGRIGSGKDTVGLIIMYLTYIHVTQKLVSFAEYSRGVSAYRNFTPYEVKKFAGKLKQITALLIGCDVADLEDQNFKNTSLPEIWDKEVESEEGTVLCALTPRALLQRLGAEALRDVIHENIHVNGLFSDYKPLPYANAGKLIYPKWVITDMRFKNELAEVKRREGISIRVKRPGTVKQNEHITETDLDGSTFDYEIENDGSIKDLIEKVSVILKTENII